MVKFSEICFSNEEAKKKELMSLEEKTKDINDFDKGVLFAKTIYHQHKRLFDNLKDR
jgi:hypothetical protein